VSGIDRKRCQQAKISRKTAKFECGLALIERRKCSWLFEHLFLQYGGGARYFKSLTSYRFWNRFCWTAIVLGILGWAVGLWFLERLSE
jgi:hypothetical protein